MQIEPLFKRLSKPAQRALQNEGITSLEQLAGWREKEIAALHGIGKNAIAVIKSTLQENGLSLAE